MTISLADITAAQKILGDCCGRVRPNLVKLAKLLGVPPAPPVYTTAGGLMVYPATGVQAFSVYALDKLGHPWAPSGEPPATTLSLALSRALDTPVAGR